MSYRLNSLHESMPPGKIWKAHTVKPILRSYRKEWQTSAAWLLKTGEPLLQVHWLVGCFGFNGPLRQYFSLYRAVSQREGEREKIEKSKTVQTTPPAPTASAIGPCPTIIQIVGRPGTGSLPRTNAPPDHPLTGSFVLYIGSRDPENVAA